jgi:site-specific recombinase XerD
MTVNFKFHSYKKKDGSQALLIRLRDKERERFIPVPGVSVNTNLWDKKNQMLSAKHPEAELLNLAIGNYHDRIKKVKMQYELNQISFEDAIMMLEGSGKVDSLKDFINMMSKQKSGQWVRNSLNAVKSFGKYTKIPDPVFKDLSYNNLETLCVSMKKSGAQPESINNYLTHLRALFNLAKKKKIIYSDFQFPKDLIQKTRRHDKKIETHLPLEIAEAISRITLKDTHRRSQINALRDFEAVGFWLLMFSMRGLYGKDITSLSAKDYNYDYNFKIGFLKGDQVGERNIKGNSNFLDHKRHKTKNKMRIMVTLPPIGGLIMVLRRLVAQTHGSLSYLAFDELEKPYAELIKKKDYDELKIFNHDPSVDIAKDDAIWNNMNKHLKKLGLYSLQSARKTFATTCSSIGIDSSIERNLLGQSDSSILRHYNNYEDKRLVYKIQQSHIMVLKTFKTVELFDHWLKQIELVFNLNHDFYIGTTSEVVYNDFMKSLPGIVNIDKTFISKLDQWEEQYKLK